MSDVKFDCPKCSGRIAVPEEGAGMDVPCPHCAQQIRIPDGYQPRPIAAATPASSQEWESMAVRMAGACIFGLALGAGFGVEWEWAFVISFYYAVWGVPAGLLAARKNRDGWAWGLLGGNAGIVTLLALMFVRYLCPRCRTPLSDHDWRQRSCPRCGQIGGVFATRVLGRSHSGLPLVFATGAAVAGITAAAVLFTKSLIYQAEVDDVERSAKEAAAAENDGLRDAARGARRQLERTREVLRMTEKELEFTKMKLEDVQADQSRRDQNAGKTPEVPISAVFKGTPSGTNAVLTLLNKAKTPLSLYLTVNDSDPDKCKTLRLVVPGGTDFVGAFQPGRSREIRSIEGRTLVAGDRVEVVCPGYGPIQTVVVW